MSAQDRWIGIPILLNHEDFLCIEKQFTRLGIHYRHKAVTTRMGPEGGDHMYEIHVTEGHAPASAQLFRHFLQISDPGSVPPFSGACPACGEEVNEAWVCPSCELSFRPEYEEKAPWLSSSDVTADSMIRNHGFDPGPSFMQV